MLLPVGINAQGVKIEVIQCSFLTKGTGYSMIRITDTEGIHSSELEQPPPSTMMGECDVTKLSNHQYMAMVTNNNCMLASIVSESGCFINSAVPISDTEIEWSVVGLNSSYVHNLISRMKSEGYGVRTLSTCQMGVETLLTVKQEECLNLAYDNGYYFVPKRITLDELCIKADCSKATFSVILREAEKKIIGNHIEMNKDSTKKKKK